MISKLFRHIILSQFLHKINLQVVEVMAIGESGCNGGRSLLNPGCTKVLSITNFMGDNITAPYLKNRKKKSVNDGQQTKNRHENFFYPNHSLLQFGHYPYPKPILKTIFLVQCQYMSGLSIKGPII